MQGEQFCVYNQTNECFLSLGATRGGSDLARLKRAIGIGPRMDEGCWISRPAGLQTFTIFSARDLIFLDEECRVVDVVEAFPPFRTAPPRKNAASVLALPLHTISSSQTRPGNQLLICAPEEMELRLRNAKQSASTRELSKTRPSSNAAPDWIPESDRRIGFRTQFADTVAYFSTGGEPAVNVIRNLSSTGLYVVTQERWPLGTEVRMSLERADVAPKTPITVRMRVTRWGADGVGLEFIQPGMEHDELMDMHVC